MAKNTLRDLDVTPANNTDVLNQSTAGTTNANTIDTVFQNVLGLVGRGYGDIGGRGTVGGTADAITLTSLSTYQALETGIVISFKASADNTGAATLNLDTLGAKKIRRQGDTALQAADIIENGTYLLRYDEAYDSAAGAWVLLNPTVAASAGGITTISTSTVNSGTTFTVTSIPTDYTDLEITLAWLSFVSGTDTLDVELSDDNGSSWEGPFEVSAALGSSGDRFAGSIRVLKAGGNSPTTAYKVIQSMILDSSLSVPEVRSYINFGMTNPVNAVRLSGGTFDGAGGPVSVRTIK